MDTETRGAPPAGQLLRSTLLAMGLAALFLMMVVMPKAFGVDPTGFGRVTGWTEQGAAKVRTARELEAQMAADAAMAAAADSAAAAAAAEEAAVNDTSAADSSSSR
jgi:hypothetical protein